ncbi:c-type cytochrome [Hymenobacter lapidarius]|nr:cytochrome c [Hymenobacter lapidarius]
MALVVVLIGFTLLSAAGLAGFSSQSFASETSRPIAVDTLAAQPQDSLAVPASAEEVAAIAAGDALFKTNCAQCHAVNEVIVGPALAGISKRRPVSWLLPWIKNSSKVVASGDEYAVAIYNKYSKQQMPSFALSDTEIKSILAWVAVEEANGAVTAAVAFR